ncbi:MAG: response regulator [Chloroflexi bacterium]|nr:response regulator [Chloroflexota bacterium]
MDDESGIVEVVARMLEEIGYPVESAGNGAEALAIIERVHPAPVLLDMRMPVLDG